MEQVHLVQDIRIHQVVAFGWDHSLEWAQDEALLEGHAEAVAGQWQGQQLVGAVQGQELAESGGFGLQMLDAWWKILRNQQHCPWIW